MSLINDALRKAQKQRTGPAAPLSSLPNVGGDSPANISRGRSNTPSGLFIGLGLGAVALVGLLIAGILLFRRPPAAPAATQVPAVAAIPAPVATNTPKVEPPPAAAKPAENMFVVPIATPAPPKPPAETAAPVASQAASPAPVVSAPVTTPAAPVVEAPAPAPTVTPATPGRMDPRAIQFIDGIKVAGIRASATDSKVLMNDRVYRTGDMVGYEFGVRLVGITANSLTFEDAHGARYTRNF